MVVKQRAHLVRYASLPLEPPGVSEGEEAFLLIVQAMLRAHHGGTGPRGALGGR